MPIQPWSDAAPEDRYLMQPEELDNKVAVLLGGRAAEVLVFGSLSTGAADDLAKATDIARDMVMRYGMDESLGHVVYQDEPPRFLEQPAGIVRPGPQVSERTARQSTTRCAESSPGRSRAPRECCA